MRKATVKKKMYAIVGTAVLYVPMDRSTREVLVSVTVTKRNLSGTEIIDILQKHFPEDRVIDFYGSINPSVFEMPVEEFLKHATQTIAPFAENNED